MALKQLVLRKRIEGLKSQLETLRTNDAGFETRSAEMKKREAEIEAAVNEVTDETSAEDKATVDAEVEKFELKPGQILATLKTKFYLDMLIRDFRSFNKF